MDRLLAMQVFTAVVDAGSFAKAADQLRMSTTATSRYVAELERHLGARLMQRSTRRLSLTETGAAYYDRCRQILADVDEAESVATSAEAEPRGVLRVSLPFTFGLQYVAPLLPAFCARYPGLQVEVSFSDRVVDLVEEGIDVALRITRDLRTTLVARRLMPVRLAVCASPEYLARRGTPVVPEDLRDHDCLTYAYASYGDTWHFLRDGKDVQVPVKGSFRANNGDMLRFAALAGQGVCIQPTFIVGDDLRAGRLVPLLSSYATVPINGYVVYLGGSRRPAKVRAFVEFCVEAFGRDNPPWDAGLDTLALPG